MDSVSAYKYRWSSYSSNIKMLVVGEGVSSISSYAYPCDYNTKGVWLPTSLKNIGSDNFPSYVTTGIYYQGPESDWANVVIGDWNDGLQSAEIVCNIPSVHDIVFVSSVVFDSDSYILPTESTLQLTPHVEPSNATNKK